MNLHKMIEIYLKDDNMHIFVMINALICINNYVITCINSMLSYMRAYFQFFSCGTIYMFLCASVMWQHVEHLIALLNHDRRSSLMAWGTWRISTR